MGNAQKFRWCDHQRWHLPLWSNSFFPQGDAESSTYPMQLPTKCDLPASTSPLSAGSPSRSMARGNGSFLGCFSLKVPVSPPTLIHGCWQPSPFLCSFAEGAKRVAGAEEVWEVEEG